MKQKKYASLAAVFAVALQGVQASSHSDAPLIKQDPQTNLTDVYTFVGTKYDDPSVNVLNVLVSVRPFSEPGDGVIYERFADDARYSIHLTNPATGAEINRYDFVFSSVTGGVKNRDTILSYGRGTEVGPIQTVGDARQNYTQSYSVSLNDTSLGNGFLVPPPNVGVRTTPDYNDANGFPISGAANNSELDIYTASTINETSSGVVAWAGPREDGFYADTPGIFDFLDPRIVEDKNANSPNLGQDGGGVDGFKGFNVLSFAIQIPLDQLTTGTYNDVFGNAHTGVGVYSSVSRRRLTLRSPGRPAVNRGAWVQTNRLANPLFNEVLVALRDKDRYNLTTPASDVGSFQKYAQNSELAFLINAVLLNPSGDGTSPLQTDNRADLVAIYIPDVIRVDTTTGPVPLPTQANYSRLGVFGGDGLGWPNGRRIGDDVVDIALSAVASGPSFDPITVVGDNVNTNDQTYHLTFPYLATPHAGPTVSQRRAVIAE